MHDLASPISRQKSVRAALRWLSFPFKNFLSLEDLSEPVDSTPKCPKLKNRILVGLASLALVGWVGNLVFGVYIDDREYVVKSMVHSASWVSIPCWMHQRTIWFLTSMDPFSVLYRSKIDLETSFDASISFHRLCPKFTLSFFDGFGVWLVGCRERKTRRRRRPCYVDTWNFRVPGRHLTFEALPTLSECCATKRCTEIILIDPSFDKEKCRYHPLHSHVQKMMLAFGPGVHLHLSNPF